MAKTKKNEEALAVVKPETEISNGTITISNQELSNAVGFDYEKQVALLSTSQRKAYLAKADSINEANLASIQTYGSDISKNIESNGDELLAHVRSNNTNNEINVMINDLLAELKMVDVDELQTTNVKRILRKIPVLRHLVMSAEKVMIKYDTIKNNVDQISARIKQHKIIAERDNNMLEIIFNNNCKYIEDIRELIIAAKVKNEELLKHIEYMTEHPEEFTPINVSDAQNFQNALAKRIADMQITEYIFNQNLFQIRAIQHNNMSLSDKAESIATTVIPIWKNQLALSVIMANQQESIAAQKKITDTTNQILRKNSEMMKMNSINVAKANEEAIVSLDTLQATTKDLIDTITEVKKIQSEGNKMRETLEHNLIEYGSQLTNKINELANE